MQFQTKTVTFYADLNNTLTAQRVYSRLPYDSTVSRWGGEISLSFPGIEPTGEFETRQVDIGDIGFSVEQQCLCVFCGPTPASIIGKPVSKVPVVIIGKTNASSEQLYSISADEPIHIIQFEAPISDTNSHSCVTFRDPYGERKLSQAEIDELVTRLLKEIEEKKRQIHQQPGMS
ncbi:MAG: cyclophilin-like fold protein [Candidatus Omnitrophica bacterium]|nr:cyclophilin-like fold protein [Candidatus Omnitrophota bacterium]